MPTASYAGIGLLSLLSAPLLEPSSLWVNYAELDDILEEEEAATLFPNWPCDCTINLTHRVQIPAKRLSYIYSRISSFQGILDSNLNKGLIHSSFVCIFNCFSCFFLKRHIILFWVLVLFKILWLGGANILMVG